MGFSKGTFLIIDFLMIMMMILIVMEIIMIMTLMTIIMVVMIMNLMIMIIKIQISRVVFNFPERGPASSFEGKIWTRPTIDVQEKY